MSRRYDEPVEVRRRDDEPVAFLWRERLWAVRAVLAHWVETGAWWQAAVPRTARAERRVPTAPGAPVTLGSTALAAGADPRAGVGREVGIDVGIDVDSGALSLEREFWRVEATRGRVHGTGVFDLCLDWSAPAGAGWTLARVVD